jgi:hypothetical protein
MYNLTDFIPTKKVYYGKLMSINFEYVGESKIYILKFRSGSVKLMTNSNPWLSVGDIVHFMASFNGSDWLATEIVKVDKKPLQKQTFKTRQANRLTEAVG